MADLTTPRTLGELVEFYRLCEPTIEVHARQRENAGFFANCECGVSRYHNAYRVLHTIVIDGSPYYDWHYHCKGCIDVFVDKRNELINAIYTAYRLLVKYTNWDIPRGVIAPMIPARLGYRVIK